MIYNAAHFHGKNHLAEFGSKCELPIMSTDVASLRKSLQVYKGLVEVSGLINSITDYDELLRAILDVARRVIPSEAASLFLVNDPTGTLDLVIASFAEGEFSEPKISVPRGRGIVGCVAENGEGLLIPDAYSDARFYKDADQKTGFRTRSILCVPLQRDGSILGVLQLLNPREKTAFDLPDLEAFTAYASLTAIAIDKLRAQERMRAQERVERDLAIASDIQTELLSRSVPEVIPGAVFAAHNHAAANVGGDFYNVAVRESGEIYFAIGDVSGKGISASLLMAQTLSAMDYIFAETTGPAEALTKLNLTLSERIVRGMFVTTLIGRILPGSGRVDLASAGHCRPILLRSDGTATEIKTTPALPLGVFPDVAYHQDTTALAAGDWLVTFTDGLSESRQTDDSFFAELIPSTLAKRSFSNPRAVVDALLEAECHHRGNGEQLDDLTILVGGLT
jgi:phosphoserine phosphatase RsbU/P